MFKYNFKKGKAVMDPSISIGFAVMNQPYIFLSCYKIKRTTFVLKRKEKLKFKYIILKKLEKQIREQFLKSREQSNLNN